MVKIHLNKKHLGDCGAKTEIIKNYVMGKTQMQADEFYLVQNGKLLSEKCLVLSHFSVHCVPRILGGKGGFGSMLRAIGAQIEKTTNREACRDLSGRRLRDINEEKRLKAWLEKQADREREAEERKKKKIEKLLHVPKHEFKDEEYEENRSKLTEKVSDAVEEGLKNATDIDAKSSTVENPRKRKADQCSSKSIKTKSALWIDDDILSSDGSEDSSDDEKKAVSKKKLNHILEYI